MTSRAIGKRLEIGLNNGVLNEVWGDPVSALFVKLTYMGKKQVFLSIT